MISGHHFTCYERWVGNTVFHQFIYHAHFTKEVKIFFVLREKRIECYLFAAYFNEPILLFELDLFFPTHQEGYLTEQLNELNKSELFTIPNSALSPELQPRSIFSFAQQNQISNPDSPIFGNLLGHQKEGSNLRLCFSTLLLDFLFDLFHSPVFKQSPHFHSIHTAIHSNTIFRAIFVKANAYYQAKVFQTYRNPISTHFAEKAILLWVELATKEENEEIFTHSPWFDPDLTVERNEASLLYQIIEQANKPHQAPAENNATPSETESPQSTPPE